MQKNIFEDGTSFEIVFLGTNFGDEGKNETSRKILVAEAVLKIASGYSCGSTIRGILVDLKLAEKNKRTGVVGLTDLGSEHIWQAHKFIMESTRRNLQYKVEGSCLGTSIDALVPSHSVHTEKRLKDKEQESKPYVCPKCGKPDCVICDPKDANREPRLICKYCKVLIY